MTSSRLLGPLIDAIETVKERIQDYGATLRENETRTRVALIDPILQALGWDVSDPSMVTLEYDVSGRRADYALLKSEGKPAATIEAKRLGQDLQQHRMQMLNYANASGVDYAGLTDGNHWELYDVFKRGELSERQLLNVSIASMSAHEAALKLLTLWRPNITEGQPVEAEEPIVEVPVPPDPPTPEPSEPPPTDDGWLALNTVHELDGSKVKPQTIKFPDGQSTSIRNWHDVWLEFGRYVHTNNLLQGRTSPLRSPAFKKPILGSNKFSETCKQVENLPIFVEWAANTYRKLRWTEYLRRELGLGEIEIRLRS